MPGRLCSICMRGSDDPPLAPPPPGDGWIPGLAEVGGLMAINKPAKPITDMSQPEYIAHLHARIERLEGRLEAISKLQCSRCHKGLATINLYIQPKAEIFALCRTCKVEVTVHPWMLDDLA